MHLEFLYIAQKKKLHSVCGMLLWNSYFSHHSYLSNAYFTIFFCTDTQRINIQMQNISESLSLIFWQTIEMENIDTLNDVIRQKSPQSLDLQDFQYLVVSIPQFFTIVQYLYLYTSQKVPGGQFFFTMTSRNTICSRTTLQNGEKQTIFFEK